MVLGVHSGSAATASAQDSDSLVENAFSTASGDEVNLLPRQNFRTVLSEISLFRNSRWERFVAWSIPLLTKLCRMRRKPAPSSVVPRMTLWEQFLTHRCRYARRMTLAVGLREQSVAAESFVASAIIELIRIVTRHNALWENQPLNVVVTDACRTRIQDPRKSTGQLFPIAFTDEAGVFRTCEVNLNTASQLHDGKLMDYVVACMHAAQPSTNPVCAVIDHAAADPEMVGGSYIEFPGAWLRVSPDQSTGGIVATADHLVLDGALFQQMLLRIARATTTPCTVITVPPKFVQEKATLGSRKHDPFATLQIENVTSLSDVLMQIIAALDNSGMRLRDGRDTMLLTTIPHGGPELDVTVPKHGRRILPVILSVEGINDSQELRNRIQLLNIDGWCSTGAVVWNYIYRGNLPHWLIRYFECLSHKLPFQRTARVLSGGALISCLPPVERQDFCAADVSHLSSRTIGTTIGGPTITVMQVFNGVNEHVTAFITISGTGCWNHAAKLNDFRRILAAKFSQLEPPQSIPPQSIPPQSIPPHQPTTSTHHSLLTGC